MLCVVIQGLFEFLKATKFIGTRMKRKGEENGKEIILCAVEICILGELKTRHRIDHNDFVVDSNDMWSFRFPKFCLPRTFNGNQRSYTVRCTITKNVNNNKPHQGAHNRPSHHHNTCTAIWAFHWTRSSSSLSSSSYVLRKLVLAEDHFPRLHLLPETKMQSVPPININLCCYRTCLAIVPRAILNHRWNIVLLYGKALFPCVQLNRPRLCCVPHILSRLLLRLLLHEP